MCVQNFVKFNIVKDKNEKTWSLALKNLQSNKEDQKYRVWHKSWGVQDFTPASISFVVFI